MNTNYPCVPGHEIVGRVSAVGSGVSKFAVGETVAVGCMVDSCGHCDPCREDLEQYCEGPHGCTMTYNGPMKPDGSNTFGGYSTMVVVKEHFVLKVRREPGAIGRCSHSVCRRDDLLAAAPLESEARRPCGRDRLWRPGTPGHEIGQGDGNPCDGDQPDAGESRRRTPVRGQEICALHGQGGNEEAGTSIRFYPEHHPGHP